MQLKTIILIHNKTNNVIKRVKSKINKLWNKFYSRGITNPFTAIEQISYLLFMRRLDDADALEKAKAIFSDQEYKSFFEGYEDCRWSHFHN